MSGVFLEVLGNRGGTKVHNFDMTLRRLAPAMMRDPSLFKSIFKSHVEFAPPSQQPDAASPSGSKLLHQRTHPAHVYLRDVEKLTNARTPSKKAGSVDVHCQVMKTIMGNLQRCMGKGQCCFNLKIPNESFHS